VVKDLNGKPTDVSPTGAAARESAFLQSYRAELTHFIAVLNEESPYDPPADQLSVLKTLEAIYKSAEEEREIRL
jgi:predicted dehydrogenase